MPRKQPRNPTFQVRLPAAARSAVLTVGTSSCTKVSKPRVSACATGIHSWKPSGSHIDEGSGIDWLRAVRLLLPGCFLLRHRRRRDAEVLGQTNLHQPGYDRDQRVVMNRMGDGIDHFTSECGTGHWRIAVSVADFAARFHRRIECAGRKRFESCAHLARQGERKVGLRLDASVTLAMVVVHFVSIEAAQQTREVVQAMAVVAANAAVEGKRDAPNVGLSGQRAEQVFALRENCYGCIEDTALVC